MIGPLLFARKELDQSFEKLEEFHDVRNGRTAHFEMAEITTSRPQNSPPHYRKVHDDFLYGGRVYHLKTAECTTSRTRIHQLEIASFPFRFRHFETANSTNLTLLDSPLRNRRFSISLRPA